MLFSNLDLLKLKIKFMHAFCYEEEISAELFSQSKENTF